VLLIILYTVHRHVPVDQWTANAQAFAPLSFFFGGGRLLRAVQVQGLFAQTDICRVLSQTRTEPHAILGQIRRWLVFCKFLAKQSNLFRHSPSDAIFTQQDMSHTKVKWMNKRGFALWAMMQKWIRDGEMSPEETDLKAEDWATADLSPFSSPTAPTESEELVRRASKEDIVCVEDMRIRTLTALSHADAPPSKLAKTQQCFQASSPFFPAFLLCA
jgi:hypothetical protein